MKIAMISFSSLPLSVGGSQIFTFNLIKKLLDKNHEIDFYLPRKYAEQFIDARLINHKNFKVKPIFYKENFFIIFFPLILKYVISIRQFYIKYDLWQVIGSYPAGYITAHLSKNIPVVLRSHGDDIQKDITLNYGLRLNSKIEKKISSTIKNFTALVALTSAVTKEYLELGANENRIKIIPNGVDNNRFNLKRNIGNLNKKNQIKLLTTGRYHKKKGYEYIVPVLKILINKGYNIEWTIIGRNTSILKKNIDDNQLQKYIKLEETISVNSAKKNLSINFPSKELIDKYNNADIYVFPSLLETFGMVLIEAMASGLPVVTTNCPGCNDVVTHYEDGLVSNIKDSKDLAKNIEIIINNGELRGKLIENGLIKSKNHDWEIIATMYENLYLKLIVNNKLN